ncbi:phage minor head protein [Dethiothermospora halolimnae]|uniref:phage minor head protein n=1 Tax=Dethiothermospora halolimnae TaxID=3114390 RepID=UPI003CCBC3FA
MSLKNDFQKLRKEIDKISATLERDVIYNYRDALKALREVLSFMYEKYEVDGKLTYQEMAKYGRIDKLDKEINILIAALYKNNTKLISNILEDVYKTSFNTTKNIVESTTEKTIRGIIKDEVIQKAIQSPVSGLRLNKRLERNRYNIIVDIQEAIGQGLKKGETYGTMAKRLKDKLEGDVPKARRIVRTETSRVFSESKKESLDKANNQGVNMTKEWITSEDEDVRSQHKKMRDKIIPYDEDFILPDGSKGFAPHQIGKARHDINCRCDWIIDIVEDGNTIKNNKLPVTKEGKSGIIKMGEKGSTGVIPRNNYKRRDAHAELYYEEIRKRKSDVKTIAKNTGWKESAIKEIKEHVFMKEHFLDGKMKRFDPDYDQAQAWQRLIEGKKIKHSDLVLLKHEYVELTQMKLHEYDYDTAHKIANKYHDWWSLIESGE